MHKTDTAATLRALILSMAKRADIHSMSCCTVDRELWEGLLAEQVRRARLTGKHPSDAFFLSGPDGSIYGVTPDYFDEDDTPPGERRAGDSLMERMGGYIHIPCEGVCRADFFINPYWRRVCPENWQKDGVELDWATPGKHCNHLLIDKDLGEAPCATRVMVADGWWLYSSTAPYKDCNPFHRHRR